MHTATVKIKRENALYELTVVHKSAVVASQAIVALGQQINSVLDGSVPIESMSLPQYIAKHFLNRESVDPQYEAKKYIDEVESCQSIADLIDINDKYKLFTRYPDYDMSYAASVLQDARIRLKMFEDDLESLRAEVLYAIHTGGLQEEAFLNLSKNKPVHKCNKGILKYALRFKTKIAAQEKLKEKTGEYEKEIEKMEREDAEEITSAATAIAELKEGT